MLSGENLYPNAVYLNYGYAYLGGKKITSALSLTKGWTGDASSETSAATGKKSTLKVQSANGAAFTTDARPKSRTSFRTARQYQKVDDFKIVSPEELQENIRNFQQNSSK